METLNYTATDELTNLTSKTSQFIMKDALLL